MSWYKLNRVFLAAVVVLAAGTVKSTNAQLGYERSTSSGTWDDGNWRDYLGPSGAPGILDSASIGWPHPSEAVTVDLATTASIASLSLLGESGYGTLHIRSGGSLTCGSVVAYGLLDVQSGGFLNTTSILISGSSAAASLGGTVTTDSISAYFGGTASINSPITVPKSWITDATLNLNSTLTANSITLSGTSAVVNRAAGGHFNVDVLTLSNSASYTYDDAGSVANGVFVQDGATFVVDAASTFGNISSTGTVTINADTTTGVTSSGGVLNLNGGTLTGSLWLGGGGQVHHGGGHFNASDLTVCGPTTSLTIEAGDNVTERLSVGLHLSEELEGATVDVNRNLNLTGGVGVVNSTLNLNANLTASGVMLSGASATVNRTLGGHFDVQGLGLWDSASYTYEGTDSFANVAAHAGTTFVVDAASTFGVIASTAQELFGMMSSSGGTVTINADTQTTDYTTIGSGVLNLNAGTLTGSLMLHDGYDGYGSAAQVHQNGGHFNAPNLTINSATSLTIGAGDNVTESLSLNRAGATVDVNRDSLSLTSLSLGDGSVLHFTQTTGSMDGISFSSLLVAETGTLDILFDATSGMGLDWGLRWSGNHQSELQDLIDKGNLTFGGGSSPIEIVYDAGKYGDFTYLASVTVPEPSSLAMLLGIALTTLVYGWRKHV